MLIKNSWFFGILFLCVTGMSHARACLTTLDCDSAWAQDNCSCGVHAVCKGRTPTNLEGHCQCMGAHGKCQRSPSSSPVKIRSANPIRRGLPVH